MTKKAPAERVTADQVLRALADHAKAQNCFFTTNVRSGPSQIPGVDRLGQKVRYFDFDGLSVARSWAHFTITVYEVKVSRNDFLRDTKWPEYRNYCHRLYIACPKGLIAKEDLPPDVGLIYYRPKSGTIQTQRASAHREFEPPLELLAHIIFSHLDSDRYPFFGKKREYFEKVLTEKRLNKSFAWEFKGRLAKLIEQAAGAQAEADRRIAEIEYEVRNLREAEQLLKRYGIDVSQRSWSWSHRLESLLKCGVGPEVRERVQTIIGSANHILRALEAQQEQQAKGGEPHG